MAKSISGEVGSEVSMRAMTLPHVVGSGLLSGILYYVRIKTTHSCPQDFFPEFLRMVRTECDRSVDVARKIKS